MLSLLDASRAILSERSVDKLVPTMLRIVVETTDAQQSALITDKDGKLAIQARYKKGCSGAEPQAEPPFGQTSAALDAEVEEFIRKYRSERQTFRAQTAARIMFAVPLFDNDTPVGALYVEAAPNSKSLLAEQPSDLDTLAANISIAFQNARIIESQKTRINELTEAFASAVARLNKTREQLMQSEKMASLGRLTVGIAHEIKNPLNFINNFAQLNVELVAEIDEALSVDPKLPAAEITDVLAEIRSGSDKIAEHSKRADSIVRSMMQHATGASGVKQPVDLNALVEDYVKLSYHSSRADHQPFELRIERDYDPRVGRVDVIVQDLARVLVNLFSNSLYALGEKKRTVGPGFVATLYVGTKRHNGTIAIVIRDNGTGIPEDARPHIFDPFFTTKPGNAGTGLGLSMSHDIIVNGHGGTIALDTVLGEHTTFTITLPT